MLGQLVKLSIECAAEERRIEPEHADGLAREHAELERRERKARERREERRRELEGRDAREREEIQGRYARDKGAVEAEKEGVLRQLSRERESAESALKKTLEKASWEAESALVTIQMQADAEERKAKQGHEGRLTELTELDRACGSAAAPFRLGGGRETAAAVDDALKRRLASEPKAVFKEERELAQGLLAEFKKLGQPRIVAAAGPWILILLLAAAAGGAAWMMVADEAVRLRAALGSAAGVLVAGGVVFGILRSRAKTRTRAQAKELHGRVRRSLDLARQAENADADAFAEALEERIDEARRKSNREVSEAREKARAAQKQTAEQHRAGVAGETERAARALAVIEEQKARGIGELDGRLEATRREIERDEREAVETARREHAEAVEAIEREYARACAALDVRWADGLRAVHALLAAGQGIDPDLVDWNSPAWDRWKSPAWTGATGQVRFGEMKVDLAQLTEELPHRLKLPESFTVPAMLTFPVRGSLLLESDHAGREASIDAARLVMSRLLTQIPPGRVKFTIFDPVGLGQSFAGFMHLADHDESLVGSRIWTEKEHIQQRLADLTEHMETVIQKYLRNEYATIDEYNAQAGELAEPFRFLVMADFPMGIEQESLRRLSSIALTGPRCGVYMIILRDTRQPLPPGLRMEEILAHSVRLVHKPGGFVWEDAVFRRFPLRMDSPPDEKRLTSLMEMVGKAAKEAKRVEVPFASIAPADGEGAGEGGFWSRSSQSDLRVPIGKSGATRLQSLRLGVGVAQHVLVAGKTGSGKSNLMHTIVTNLAMWYGPDEVEFYLVDFKKGVEFKAYATSELPHARAIAVESDREFGLSVLQRVDAELSRRGALFREAGAQELGAYREKTGEKMPRTVLLVDEFQEFFSEDDKVAQEASGLLDRLVRQGRAFGVHVVLGSQTIGGSSGLARSTLGQIAVRVALQCTEADSQMILGDNNSAARLLSRPGEAVYNDAGGLVEANSPFQIAFLPDQERGEYLEKVHALAKARQVTPPAPIVFEGNTAAAIRKNRRLAELLARRDFPPAASVVTAYVGEPVAIKEPASIPLRRQSGANVLLVGQQEESAVAIFASMAASIAAQQKPGVAIFYLMDGSPADSRFAGVLERVMRALPQQSRVVAFREVPEAINELATMLAQRQGNADAQAGPAVYLLMFGLQRFRALRRQEEDFSFSRSEEAPAAKPDKQFAELLSEGPAAGIHSVIWADTPITVERTLERSSMRQFDHRILFQMSATDSSNLIDSPLANRLGTHRALLYSEEQGTAEKFRPYEAPDEEWLKSLAEKLGSRTV
jgi:hypothetical protein